MQGHIVTARHLDGAGGHHTCSGSGHLEHLLVRDLVELAGAGDEPRVGREDAAHVGEDLAGIGPERGGKGDRGRVGAAAAERRHVLRLSGDTLEARDEHDLAAIERLVDPVRAHLDDLRLRMHGVGHDPRL